MHVLCANVAQELRDRLSRSSRHSWRALSGDPVDPSIRDDLRDADAVVCGLPETAGVSAADALLRASAGVYNLLAGTAIERFVLLSSLAPFESYPIDHHVSEYWAPRPTTDVADLVAVTAEAVVREISQTGVVTAVCLRLARVEPDDAVTDARAVHIDDVAQAVERALDFKPDAGEPAPGWWVFHVVGAGRPRFALGLAGARAPYPNGGRGSTLGYAPRHDLARGAPVVAREEAARAAVVRREVPSRPRVTIFGAGGPFAAAAAAALAPTSVLRLTDARPYEEIVRSAVPQQVGAPTPVAWPAPHDTRVVDITEFEQVLTAVEGADAILNLAVVREHPIESFRVNVVGAYNVARAAVAAGIRRLVLTGPNQVFHPMCGAYWADFDVSSDVPQRPGAHIYMLSKFLGNEIVRIFAEAHDLEVPVLVYGYFSSPEEYVVDHLGGHPFTVSWNDTGESMRAALTVRELPRPYEVLHVLASLPHGKYRNDRLREALQWEPRDRLEHLWRRPR